MKASIAGLVAFIKAQPTDRATCHLSWAKCAVGDYAREVLGHEIVDTYGRRGIDDPIWHHLHSDEVLNALWMEAGTSQSKDYQQAQAYPMRDADTIMDILNSAPFTGSTYGDIVDALVKRGLVANHA